VPSASPATNRFARCTFAAVACFGLCLLTGLGLVYPVEWLSAAVGQVDGSGGAALIPPLGACLAGSLFTLILLQRMPTDGWSLGATRGAIVTTVVVLGMVVLIPAFSASTPVSWPWLDLLLVVPLWPLLWGPLALGFAARRQRGTGWAIALWALAVPGALIFYFDGLGGASLVPLLLVWSLVFGPVSLVVGVLVWFLGAREGSISRQR